MSATLPRPRLLVEDRDERLRRIVAELLETLGEETTREGLARTPERVARALTDLTSGAGQRVEDVVGDALFQAEGEGMVVVRDIGFHSLCEHHLLPFSGTVDVAYLPGRKIIGLSKIPRIVGVFARRLQVQERLTRQIADAIESVLDPRGVAVRVEATHMCMRMRGVMEQGSRTVTTEQRRLPAPWPHA